MEMSIIPNSTTITDIVTTYETTLKIDDAYDITVIITDVLAKLNNIEESAREIFVGITNLPDFIKTKDTEILKQYVDNVRDFVKENIDTITKELK